VKWFDRFAAEASEIAARAPFFVFCVLVVIIWAPTMFILDINTSQLIINTTTTIITFLMVALLQNSGSRADQAVQEKLNAIADALSTFMAQNPQVEVHEAVDRLRKVVGLEERVSSKKQ
jgi:low affinity Fe/Cu permease